MAGQIAAAAGGRLGLIVVVALIFAAIFAPLIALYDYAQQNIPSDCKAHRRRTGWAPIILAATSSLGSPTARALRSPRLCRGADRAGDWPRLGLLAGYVGGWPESLVLILTDTLQAFPAIILVLALLALIGPSVGSVIVVIAIAFAPGYARVVRAQVMAVKVQPFIEVGRAVGASDARIVAAHILPNIIAPLIILLAMDLASAITSRPGCRSSGWVSNRPRRRGRDPGRWLRQEFASRRGRCCSPAQRWRSRRWG